MQDKYPGNMVPVHSQDIPDPAMYTCKDCATLSVYCRAKDGVIKDCLRDTPFEFVSNDFVVYVSDMTQACFEVGGFYDMGLIIPVRYGDVIGGHYLYEFESEDYGIACGREIWGYPKKFADGMLEEKDGKVIAAGIKRGVEIIKLEVDFNKPVQKPLPDIKLIPHIQLQTIPAADHHGIYSQRICARDTSADYVGKRAEQGAGKATLRSVVRTPIGDFDPEEVYGATFTVGDTASTEEHGWAKILAVLVKP